MIACSRVVTKKKKDSEEWWDYGYVKSRVSQILRDLFFSFKLFSNLFLFLIKILKKQPRLIASTLSNLVYSSLQYIYLYQLTENLLANIINVFLKANPKAYSNSSSCWNSTCGWNWSLYWQSLTDFPIFIVSWMLWPLAFHPWISLLLVFPRLSCLL